MLELLPFDDDESPSFLDELAEEMDVALDASFSRSPAVQVPPVYR